VLKDFFQYLGLIVASFLVLLLVFTLFELLGDICEAPRFPAWWWERTC